MGGEGEKSTRFTREINFPIPGQMKFFKIVFSLFRILLLVGKSDILHVWSFIFFTSMFSSSYSRYIYKKCQHI